MASTSDAVRTDVVGGYTLALADDSLIASHRLTEWVARAPQLEEDVAIGNIALDLLGQARLLLQYAGSLADPPVTEDDLAYVRDERAFHNVSLVERTNGDFAVTMVRLLVLAAYQHALYSRLVHSTDETLAAIAAKAVKEVDYHRDHARQWVLRLGDGTPESHDRTQAALDAEWPWVDELFDGSWLSPELVASGVAVDPVALEAPTLDWVRAVLHGATLTEPDSGPAVSAGRDGRHTEALGYLLAEMQHLARSHPGGDVVTGTGSITATEARAWVAGVLDPELPMITIEDLGILREVTVQDGVVHVTITPTYAGCPAMDAIRADIEASLPGERVVVSTVLAPAWSTDDITPTGRYKLDQHGIAPPGIPARTVGLTLTVRCPQCGSPDTRQLSRFGSTACKALWVCNACAEPFDRFKEL